MTATKTETIEMVDHTRYSSSDGWQTIYEDRRGSRQRRVPEGRAADRVRFLAISQASWQGDAF